MSRASKNRIDMTGKIYNSWKIIKYCYTKDKTAVWEAECLECNRTFEVKGPNIRYGKSKNCIDCGNKRSSKNKLGIPYTKRTPKETSVKYLYTQEKNRAKNRRKLSWDLDLVEFTKLIYGNCHYCGEEPSNRCNPTQWSELSQRTMEGSWIIRNGIDRVDNSKGYIIDNVVACCKRCNWMKREMTTEDFIAHIVKINQHMLSKI